MLRFRLSLLLAAALLLSLGASVFLSVALFERHQAQELTALLRRELQRVVSLMADPTVGERLLNAGYEHLSLQLVGSDGLVVVPAGDPPPIPLGEGWQEWGEKRVLVTSAAWTLGGRVPIGTIRLGYDGEEALATRNALRTSLLLAASVTALLAGVVALVILRRQLRPLAQLAEQAGALQPADPRLELPPLANDEVGRVGAALQLAVTAIRERQRDERQALAGVAHELAAPLTVVAGQLEALAAHDPSPQLRAARDAARELLHTSQDLLTLARGELRLPVELSVVALAEVAARVCAEYPGVRFEASTSGLVVGNQERLAQVVRNLIRNAVQATPSADGVRVNVYGEDDAVVLTVVDDGSGLDDEVLIHLFDQNFTRKAARGGAGIGLGVVKALVEAHGGTVTPARVSGGGTSFTVRLPSLDTELDA